VTEASPARTRETLQQAFEAFLSDRDPQLLLARRTELVDSIVQSAAPECLSGTHVPRIGVAAVGGYGRRELFPYSDVDILLLVEVESDLAKVKDAVAEFLRALWDSGLRVSHSVRTIAECCRWHDDNIELHISLLDLRFLCGDRELFSALSERLPHAYNQDATVLNRRLSELTRHRHAKFNDTVYHLEPNIKEAPGGIRDIHLLRWLGQLLPQHGAIVELRQELETAAQFLYGLRCFLHIQAGRDNNLLNFERQDEAARRLLSEPLAPEAWMRLYFQHARRVFQSSLRALEHAEAQNPSLLGQFRDWRSRLSTREFTISRDRIYLRNPAETLNSAESILGLFSFAGRHGMHLSWDAQRRLRGDVEKLSRLFSETPPAWRAWRELLSQPRTALALGEMQQTALLAAAIPEWRSIDSLVVRDFYHRYTVDEHTFIAIETIDNLIANRSDTPSRFHEFLIEQDDQTIVRLALLLHDIGKGTDPGDHVRGSLAAAHSIMQRLKVPERFAEAVLFLIEHHLDLSLIMNGRDIDDPATARFLTGRIGTREDLRRLALVTYADITAVNPTAMTPWRLEQLWRVYATGEEQLTRELASERIDEISLLHDDRIVSPRVAEFLDGLPKRYLRTHTREQIEHHFSLADKVRREGVAAEISREAGAYLLTLSARDQPGLFASLCGALASFGMSIVKAEAASNANGYVLDLIRFTDPTRTLELNPEEMSRVEWTVKCVVRGSIEVTDLLKRRRQVPRPSTHVMMPAVRFDDHASDSSTLIEFAGEDRPGLLYDLASAISDCDCNIELVLVDTEGHRAFDVFYVTHNGRKLSQTMQNGLHARLMRVGDGIPEPA
jgi:[protein-PII] uridylyltransferase